MVSPAEADDLARLLSVLGDPVRARILSALVATDELCVGDLALTLEVSEDAVSYALRVLRANRLVRRRAEGRMGYYRLASPGLRSRLDATLRDLRDLAGPGVDPAAGTRPQG